MVKLFNFRNYYFGHSQCLAFWNWFAQILISKFNLININFSGCILSFYQFGLVYGLKLKENIGNILTKERIKKMSDKTPEMGSFDFDGPAVGDGIGGIILSIILWILISVVFIFLLYCLGVFFWVVILLFTALLYWIFFRALRLVFKNSKHCKGNLLKSFAFGFFYSFLYISWIYGIIFLVNYLH
ncbi:hypothetical protein [Chryseobacterium sp. Leaf405]|uniref:hypothetical protein n=1 Tax=Chryseobacterium sp. Leaf405 TaxID=1736367 RepID=UPI00103DD085|nr:hypothetical protein [Chryseobacterium sp. Leaf405]